MRRGVCAQGDIHPEEGGLHPEGKGACIQEGSASRGGGGSASRGGRTHASRGVGQVVRIQLERFLVTFSTLGIDSNISAQTCEEQECIPVGCVLTAAVATTTCQYWRCIHYPILPGRKPPWEETDPLGGDRPPPRRKPP